MKTILFIVLVLAVYLTLRWIVRRCFRWIRDRAAHNVLGNEFDYSKEKEEILSINKKLNFIADSQDSREFIRRFYLK